ncbi:Rv1355c family protein [Mycolicibacterium mengxianglii]|uniref:Rv1355c family protein n=1 Tax=Mycolicibacterium mengxianglii TaxID=2736649 RepID=UPI0018D0CAED|nr:Rv1355c family protein [Mycolicibacterium mengxianglii]
MSRPPHDDGAARPVHTATLLDETDERQAKVLEELRADPRIEFLDTLAEQRETLSRLRPVVSEELSNEPHRWAYYPWRRTVVGVLGPQSFAVLRLDRNRNLITAQEQARLSRQRVGVVGLSVGHAIAHTLALQGVVGHLRLADFDTLEVSNLNRVPGTVFDLGVNKAVIAARRIAELDPYLSVEAWTDGVTPESVDEFLADLDVAVEECDSLDLKVVVREAARARRIPVLMSTADRGLVDVERFDLEPDRPVLHGLLREIDSSRLAGLSTRDKVPHMLRFLEITRSSARGAASMLEVNRTLTTWPQLAGEVVLGATSIVECVRRIGVGQPLPSGRARVDVEAALDALEEPAVPRDLPVAEPVTEAHGEAAADVVAAAAVRAPSGGNTQPWRVTVTTDAVTVQLLPERTSRMDVAYRASAVSLGASVFNARVAAAAVEHHAVVEFEEPAQPDDGCPLRATVRLATGAEPGLGALYGPMLARSTNRHLGTPEVLPSETIRQLRSAAESEGAQLQLLTERAAVESAARLMAAADRIRYLTATLHQEMISELRWPGDPHPDTGLDIASLGLEPNDLVMLDILRRPDVMAWLEKWDAGSALGEDTFDRVVSSSGLAVVTIAGDTLYDYARGGAATEAVWIAAHQAGLSVQPVSPVFLYAHDDADLEELSPRFATELRRLQDAFTSLTGTGGARAALVLRLSHTSGAPIRSRREAYTRSMVEA